jgi:hypothetical protein
MESAQRYEYRFHRKWGGLEWSTEGNRCSLFAIRHRTRKTFFAIRQMDFVSGHDFSRAERDTDFGGFSLRGTGAKAHSFIFDLRHG